MICFDVDELTPCLKDLSTGETVEDVMGFCRNKEIMDHFVRVYDADPIRVIHEYQIGIYGEAARKIREMYDYEWTDEEL